MDPSYLAKVAKALQSGRRFSDSDPTYLSDVTQLLNNGMQNNMSERQREELRKIETYLKVYGEDPRLVEALLEKYHMNNWKSPQSAKAWY
jgi:hypothetical protein